MESTSDFSNLSEGFSEAPKRPQFLTVLCILSFIGIGLMFAFTLMGMVMNTPERQAEQIEQLRQVSPSMADEMEDQLLAQQDSVMYKIQNYINLLFLLGSFLGVMQMWKLKRSGLYIYAVAELVPYLFMIAGGKEAMQMFGSMGGGGMQSVMYAALIMVFVFDAAFVIMYAVNLKYLK
jgi:hypothetical protein